MTEEQRKRAVEAAAEALCAATRQRDAAYAVLVGLSADPDVPEPPTPVMHLQVGQYLDESVDTVGTETACELEVGTHEASDVRSRVTCLTCLRQLPAPVKVPMRRRHWQKRKFRAVSYWECYLNGRWLDPREADEVLFEEQAAVIAHGNAWLAELSRLLGVPLEAEWEDVTESAQ